MFQPWEIEQIADRIFDQIKGSAQDPKKLERMLEKTTARIGVGRAGPRLKTRTLLKLRADHAAARDAVFLDVGQNLIKELGLLPVMTC